MKYSLMILSLLLIIGMTVAADLTVYNTYYVTANTTYDWTLVKTADRTNLEFEPGPDPNPEVVVFTIDITRSAPFSLAQKIGTISITNNGTEDVIVIRVKDSIAYQPGGLPPGPFVDDTILFEGSHTIPAGQTWHIPFVFTFTTTYPLGPYAYHYNYVKVLTNEEELFQYVDAFHVSFPGVVNETLHVWDEFTVPPEFSYTWDYNGPWTDFGSATHTINVSITNQLATSGTFQAVDYAFGSNECGFWVDTVYLEFHVTQDSEWNGYTYTPGYWKNHPEAFDQWLPVTIATVTVTTVSQALNILRTNNPAWPRFLKFLLAMKFNCLNDPSLLDAYYNDKSVSGEFMEGQTVANIISVADGYTASTPEQTLNAMKDVLDKICNNATTHVLWLTYNGGSGRPVTAPTTSSFALYPNPFVNQTEIRFLSEVREPITVSVYDISGAKIRDLVMNANSTLYWDGTDNNGKKLSRGIYILRVKNSTVKALIYR